MKKILISPFLIIFVVWMFFSFPYFFQGLVPFPSSYQVNFFPPWNAYDQFASPYKNEATPDVIGQIYPWRNFTINTWKMGQIPLWNPYSFSGTFHLANYQSAVFSPLNIGFFIFPFIEWWSVLILLQPLLAGIFMLLYVRTLKFSWISQMLSSIAFMFCGFLTTWMLYGTLGYAILLLPLALFAIEKYALSLQGRYLLLLFFCVPLSFFSGHFQISLYFLLFIIYYIIFKLIVNRDKKFILLVFSVFLGVLASSAQILPSIEAYSQSLRSGIFQKVETIPWMYLPTFLAPDFFGNPVTRNAWFGHYAEWNAFIGIVPLFFAAFALFFIKRKEILLFTIPLFLSLLLAFPSPLLDLLVFLKVPVLSTSAASRIIVLFSFSASVLSGYGFMYFYEELHKKRYKKILGIFGLFIFLFVILWGLIFGKLFFEPDKLAIAFSNLRFPSAIFAALSGIIIVFLTVKREKIRNILMILIISLAVFDSLRFAIKWQPFEPKELVFVNTEATKFYSSLPDKNARVFMNSGAEGIMYYNLQGVEGYDAVYIKRYGDFISSLQAGELQEGFRSVVAFPKDSPHATRAADFLGIKYIIHKVSDGQNVWAFPFWKYNPESIHLLFTDGKYEVLENKNAYPRTFLVPNVITESNPQSILSKMFSPDTNLRETAIVEEPFEKTALGTGSAQIVLYTPNKVTIQTSSFMPSFLVLTDSYSPGWNVYVNGVEERVYRTDFAFRGVFVPEGENIVEFLYRPKSFIYGMYVEVISIVGIICLLFVNKKRSILNL